MVEYLGVLPGRQSVFSTGASRRISAKSEGRDDNLAQIASGNEQIKQVRRLAEDISLIATNAMLVARHAGNHAIGFRVVARELRSTSDRMAVAMQSLSRLVYQLVLAVARCRSAFQRTRAVQATAATHARAAAAIDTTLSDSRRRYQGCVCEIRTMTRELDAAVHRAGRQCENGLIIARAAAIEAAYGGRMHVLLRQIASHFESSIEQLAALIRGLRHQLRGMAA